MALLQFKNNAATTLSGSINNSQTAITVASSANFPSLSAGDFFYATMYETSSAVEINIEIVKVTATSGNNWTIVRAQDGTSARSRDGVSVCSIENRMTAASAQLMVQKDNNLSDLPSAATARTNLGLGSMATQNAAAVAITGGTMSGVAVTGIDSSTTIQDDIDSTKKVQFQVSGVTTGTTRSMTIPNADGTLALVSDLTSGYQPLDADLTALAALSANGLMARTGAGTVAVRAVTQPAAGITVTNGDGVSGNPTLALANDLAAVEALTTTGFVRRTGAETWSASAIVDGDIPSALTGKTYNAITPTANATGFSLAGGTTSKTLTVTNSMTLSGTDGTTITLPSTTGTVALNNQTQFIGTTAVALNRASAALSLTGVSIDGAAGSATTATTATKATHLVGGNSTTLLGSIGYQSAADTTTLLSPNVTATKLFMAQTGTGTNGAAPVWSAVGKADVGLSAVENTALSTWAGSANLTTLGAVATGTWNATTIGIAKGGTGQTTAVAAFDALSPATTLGDTIYSDGTDNVRLAGNTTATRKFIRQTGTGTVSAAPVWDTLLDADLPSALTGKSYNALSLTAASVGFTLAGGTTSKTLTVSNTLTLAGTDASTLNIGAGGTLGSAAYTASTAYAPAAGSASIVTLGTVTAGTWTGSAIGISYGGTGAASKAAGFNALSPVTTLGDLIYGDGANSNTRLAGNTAAAKRFLTQTGNGTISAAPGWNAILDGDLPSALTGKTYNALSLTAAATGFTLAGGTTSKTLTVSNTLTLAGTDASTLNIGAGGTLGSAAFTAATAYAPAAGSASVTTLGTVATGTWNATAIGISYGGTGAATKAAGFNALSPMTTLGDVEYHDGSNGVRLAGNTVAAKRFFTQTGNGTVSAAPGWNAIIDGDLPAALTGKTYNALTLTANATGFSASGGTTSKTLTVNNSLTLAGTDGTTITLPATTGTVALNNQTQFIGTTSVALNRTSGALSLTGVNIDGSAGSAATATKATSLAGGNSTTLLGALPYQSNTDTSTLLSPNITTTKLFLSQTGTGANGAAPAWGAVTKADVGLGSVENTALSSWAGSANITTLGTVATGTWNATTIGLTKGGTGQITALASFNALSPATTLGDTLYHNGTNNVRFAGNTTTTRKFIRQTGTGTVSAAPVWDTLTDGDLPTALTGKTYNALSLTAAAAGFTVAGGTTSKTLTVSNTLTLSGTDGSTLNIGSGGTLGSAAFTASTAYAPAAGSASITALGTVASGTWNATAIGIAYGGTGATTAAAALTALGAYAATNPAGYTTNTGTVTGVTGTAPIVSSGGTAPAISISAATTAAAGSMSAADKTKLDGIATGATANTGTVTGVTGTAPIASSGGTAPAISISAATTLAAGSMSAADKTKLDGIAAGATANTGTVTSVSASVPAFLSITGSPVTTTGTLAITYSGTALPVANGGTGVTTSTGTGNTVLSASPTFTGTMTVANMAGGDGVATRMMLKDTGFTYFNSGATNALDYTNGSNQRWTPATGAQTLTITNWPPTGNLGELLIEGVNLAAATITWPTINWVKSDGTTTTTFSSNGVTLQSAGTDFVVLWTRDAGTTIYGKVVR